MDAQQHLIAEALLEIIDQARSGGPRVSIGLMAQGSELGENELLKGAVMALEQNPALNVVAIGPRNPQFSQLDWIDTPNNENDIVAAMEEALSSKKIAGAVALHYPFPIGVATIGRVVSPGKGKALFIASCTGTTAGNRVEAMVRNALYGIATAKASGNTNPSVGVLNLDGAGTALRILSRLQEHGYPVHFGASARSDGGTLLRGNDAVAGAVDVLVCDTLTGNVLIKIFSTYTTGGYYESIGWGYGPSTGERWDKIVSIISRSSGAPVIANALNLTACYAQNKLPDLVQQEIKAANRAGLEKFLAEASPKPSADTSSIAKPPVVPVDAEISGVDVLDMERAAEALWKVGIYAETAMGCTGPVVRVPSAVKEKATAILHEAGFI